MSRYIADTSDISYLECYKIFSISPLSCRRKIMDLTFLFKYLLDSLDVDCANAISLVDTDATSSNLLRVHVNAETYKGLVCFKLICEYVEQFTTWYQML